MKQDFVNIANDSRYNIFFSYRKWLRRLSFTKKLIIFIVGSGSAYVTWLSALPKIEITLTDSRFTGNMPSFTITNSGWTSTRNMVWDCAGRAKIYVGEEKLKMSDFKFDDPNEDASYSEIGSLKPGGEAVRRCRDIKLPAGTNLSPGTIIAPLVQYTSLLWPYKQTKMLVYRLRGKEYGEWYWEYKGPMLSEEEVKGLEAQGYDTNNLDYIETRE